MRARHVGSILGACLLLMSSAASAHHAFSSEFDASKPIILKGKVVKTEWVNPHS
jgi:hypothetical protein